VKLKKMIKVLIIEDEPFAQNEMKRLLTNSPFDIEFLKCIDSIEDAIAYFNTNEQPDLVFFDIQLSDGISFEIFNKVKVTAPVIFTTAYNEYAIQAFKVNSIDYLLKPIEQKALDNALNKLNNWKKQIKGGTQQLSSDQLHAILEMAQSKTEYKSRLVIKVGDQIKFVSVSEIAYFYAEENEVFVLTFDKHRYIVDFTLDQLSNIIDPLNFYRLNRGYVVNKEAIIKVHKYFNSRLKIELKPQPDAEVLVSRVKVTEFLNWMEK